MNACGLTTACGVRMNGNDALVLGEYYQLKTRTGRMLGVTPHTVSPCGRFVTYTHGIGRSGSVLHRGLAKDFHRIPGREYPDLKPIGQEEGNMSSESIFTREPYLTAFRQLLEAHRSSTPGEWAKTDNGVMAPGSGQGDEIKAGMMMAWVAPGTTPEDTDFIVAAKRLARLLDNAGAIPAVAFVLPNGISWNDAPAWADTLARSHGTNRHPLEDQLFIWLDSKATPEARGPFAGEITGMVAADCASMDMVKGQPMQVVYPASWVVVSTRPT